MSPPISAPPENPDEKPWPEVRRVVMIRSTLWFGIDTVESAVARSMSTMLTYTARMSRDPDSLADVGRYWIDRMERMFRAMVEQRELVAPDRSVDVRFEDFMADDIATVRAIYDLAEHPWTAETESAMRAYMAAHPRGVHGSVTYHIADDFGVDVRALSARLEFYADRFALRREV